MFFTPLYNTFAPVASNATSLAYNSSTRIPPDCIILERWVFENVIVAAKPFVKALQIFGTCVLVNNLCGESAESLELPTIFDEKFKVSRVPLFYFWS